SAGTGESDKLCAARVIGYPFDDLMNAVPAQSKVHLGPTPLGKPFLTRGFSENAIVGWQPKAGMKILGAGVDSTTLQLIGTQGSNTQFFAVGHSLATGNPLQANPLDTFEVGDLTIDCSLVNQSGTQVACGAVRVMGNHARVRRVKAINWGSNY